MNVFKYIAGYGDNLQKMPEITKKDINKIDDVLGIKESPYASGISDKKLPYVYSKYEEEYCYGILSQTTDINSKYEEGYCYGILSNEPEYTYSCE